MSVTEMAKLISLIRKKTLFTFMNGTGKKCIYDLRFDILKKIR